MTQQWTVHLADGRTAQITADEVTSRDNSLWFLRATAPPPAKLETIAVFNARTWTSVLVEGAPVLPTHTLVYAVAGRTHVMPDDAAPPPPLAQELRQLYPRRPSTPELWETPEELNQPLERSALPANITRGEALALLRQLAENRPGSAVGATNGLQPCNYPKPNRRSRQKANQP